MSAALNPKRFFSGPDRPMSADPTSMRPSFSSFSSFSSIFSGGRHSRSNSSAQNSGAPPLARPASAAPTQQTQTKWVPRPTTPGMPTTMSQSRSSRHRSTSSASAAAAALSSSADHPLPPIPAQPQDSQQRRSSPVPSPGEGAVDSDALEVWKAEMKLRVEARYMRRLTEERKAFGLTGRLPFRVNTLDEQCDRAYDQLESRDQPIRKNTFLQSMKDQNWVLYYALLSRHLTELIPIIYTPTEV